MNYDVQRRRYAHGGGARDDPGNDVGTLDDAQNEHPYGEIRNGHGKYGSPDLN